MKTSALLLCSQWLILGAGTMALAVAGCSSDASSPDSSVDAGAPDALDASSEAALDATSPDVESPSDANDGSHDAGPVDDGGELGDGGGGAERGLSAWVYENRQEWAEAMNAYDATVQEEQRLSYLFPYAGGAEISGGTYGSQSVWFDSAVIDYYAALLPGTRMLPIFDSADGNNFAGWSDADQRKFAGDVADQLLASANITGAQIDIEPFHVEHLPFYDELGQRLHSEGKTLTVFTGASSGDIYTIADVVVLSGYDLGITPVTPTEYTTVLNNLVGVALQSASAAGARLMVGVPITASWEEYATQTGTCDHDTGYTQDAWFAAALAAVCPHTSHASYLGLSLWGFYGDALEIPRGSGCFRHPGAVPPANWGALTTWANGGCN